MTYETYRLIFIIAAILSGIFLAVAGELFFALKIPQVFGYLTGTTAKQAIRSIREQNEQTGGTGGRRNSEKLSTEKISTGLLQRQAAISSSFGITEALSPAQQAGMENSIPESGVSETTVLAQTVVPMAFIIERDITFLPTEEEILV